MSSIRSDILKPPHVSGLRETLLANLPLPFVLGAMVLIGLFVEGTAVDAYNRRIVMLIGFNIILAVSLQLINGFSGQFSLGHAGFMAVGAYMAAYPALNMSAGLTDPGASLWFYVTLAVLVGVVGSALLMLFWGVRATQRIHPTMPVILFILVLAWILIDIAQAAKHPASRTLYVWSNLFSLITRSFDAMMTHGQPIASKALIWLPEIVRQPICFLVLILGAGCCAGVMGLIVGMPALRLRGDYLAIATLGLAEIIRILIQTSQPLGGALGLTGIRKATNFAWLYGFAAITIAVIWRVAYSAKGRAIMAVREDEIAANSVGIDATHHKVMAFIIGSFFGGVAGALFALHERSITPSYFGLAKSIESVVMVTLGGLGSISGAILTAVILTVLLELLRDPPSLGLWGWMIVIIIVFGSAMLWRFRRNPRFLWVGIGVLATASFWEFSRFIAHWFNIQLSDYRMIIYSASLVLMMLLRPQGLLGGHELWPRRKRAAAGTATA